MTSLQRIAALLFLVAGTSAYGQNWTPVQPSTAAEAYYAAVAKYAARTQYRMAVEVTSYRDQADKEPEQVVSCDIRRAGELYRADHFGRVSYQDARMRVMVVPEQRTLVVGAGQEAFDLLGAEIRREMFTNATKATRSNGPDGVRYRVHLNRSYKWEHVEFTYDDKGWMRQLALVVAEPMAVEPGNPLSALVRPKVVFAFGSPGPLDLTADELSWSSVLALRGTKPEGIGAYAGYELIDTRPR